MADNELEGKVAAVTGAGRGIGRAVALELAKAGCSVVLVARSPEALNDVAAEISALGGRALAVPADVSRAEDVEAFTAQAINQFGGIDILINNAGITRDGLLLRMKPEEWDQVMAVNLRSAFLCTKAVVKGMMKKRFGRIVSISSVVGLMGNSGQANYAASKAGLIGFTRSIARELASRNITANAVAPGYIQTEMTQQLAEAAREAIVKQVPMNSLGTTADVAGVVRFLVSPAARYITGQVINVDGGMAMQ